MWKGLAAAVACAAMLCGCATYYDPYYVHSVYRAADATDAHLSVFYLTDRQSDPGEHGGFNYTRAGTPSCGVVTADIPPARLPGGDPIFASEDSNTPTTCGDGERQLAASIARDAEQKHCGAVMVFVHGFNTGFRSAVLRAAQLGLDTQWRCPVAAFSWTSAGNPEKYDTDLQNNRAAEPLFANFLRAMSDAGLKIDIVAHSMGTRLVLETLAQGGVHANQVIFAAPDIGLGEDNDQFAALARAAEPNFARLTVYASRQDAVLAISRKLNNGVRRLGRYPGIPAPDKTDIIDASEAPADYTGHEYYELSYEGIADIALVLDGISVSARLAPRPGAEPTLLAGEDDRPPKLNVTEFRTPDIFMRIVRWVIATFVF